MSEGNVIKWHARFGLLNERSGGLKFEGGSTTSTEGQTFPNFGNYICNATLSDGTVRGKIEIADTSDVVAAGFIIWDQPENDAFLVAGLGGSGYAFSVRAFNGQKWIDVKGAGVFQSLCAGRIYDVRVAVLGGRLDLLVDGALVLRTSLRTRLPLSNVGFWCQSSKAITLTDFEVASASPAAFVIMQFSEPYNELYSDVIVPVCKENGIVAARADEICGPGLILQDVTAQIEESAIIIAEITPPNQNVFYELGYAHALGKPTILITERGKTLPFDIGGYRTLFYENSIAGKRKIEDSLRKHLRAILSESSVAERVMGVGVPVEHKGR